MRFCFWMRRINEYEEIMKQKILSFNPVMIEMFKRCFIMYLFSAFFLALKPLKIHSA